MIAAPLVFGIIVIGGFVTLHIGYLWGYRSASRMFRRGPSGEKYVPKDIA